MEKDNQAINPATSTASKKSGGKLLVKVGLAMLLVSGVMTGGFYSFLQAQSVPYNPAEHKISTQERNVTAQVVNVEIHGPIDLRLEQSNTPKMSISGEQGLLDDLHAVVDGDTLKISGKGLKMNSHHNLRVALSLPNLQNLKVQGSGDVLAKGFSGETMLVALRGSGDVRFDGQYKNLTAQLQGSGDLDITSPNSEQVTLELTGSGDITAKGQAKNLQTKVKGSGELRADNLIASVVNTESVGSGETQIHAKQSVQVDIRGTGEVNVYGNPTTRNVNALGHGEVNFR